MKRMAIVTGAIVAAACLSGACAGSPDAISNDVHYRIYNNYFGVTVPDFDTLTVSHEGWTADFSLVGLPGAAEDHFAARLEGSYEAPATELYSFQFGSDDGALFYIDDSLLVNNDGKHGIRMVQADILLTKGSHKLRVDYFNYDKALQIKILFRTPGSDLRGFKTLGSGVPAFVNRQAEETLARLAAWKGSDDAIIFPLVTDVHTAAHETWKHIGYIAGLDSMFGYDFMLNLGDIGLNDPFCNNREYADSVLGRTLRQMRLYPGKFLFTPGNHDWDAGAGEWYSDSDLTRIFLEPELAKEGDGLQVNSKFCSYVYDLPGRNLRLVSVNSRCSAKDAPAYYYYSPEELDWLEQQLSSTPQGSKVLVLSHYAPGIEGRCTVGESSRMGEDSFMDIVSAHADKVLAVLCGDSHTNCQAWHGGVSWFISQGYGGDMPDCQLSPYGKRARFDYLQSLCCDIIAYKPSTGELRSFRLGAGGEDMDCCIRPADDRWKGLRSGDLVFVQTPASGGGDSMDEAIVAATGGEGLSAIHVGIVDVEGGAVSVIDATPSHGVSRRPLYSFLADFAPAEPAARPRFSFMRVSGAASGSENAAVEHAKAFLGRAYDHAFLPDNAQLYCSELVQLCYLGADGKPVFEAAPMNFKSGDGSISEYWVRSFRELGMPVPQDVPGTNPNGMMHSGLLVEFDALEDQLIFP